jgi:type II secretory ATPase GspE/PulE/Tfp pilus assembly ATPase PilB-like protein
VIPSSDEIETAAIKSGMRTMRQDGFLKAIAGETTIEEIYRVLG